jgi:hypothetical protein
MICGTYLRTAHLWFQSYGFSYLDAYQSTMDPWCQRGFDIGRVQSCVLRLPKYWPPSPPGECVLPRTKGGGVQTRRLVKGVVVNILEDAWHRIGLLQYYLSTVPKHHRSRTLIFYTLGRLIKAIRDIVRNMKVEHTKYLFALFFRQHLTGVMAYALWTAATVSRIQSR